MSDLQGQIAQHLEAGFSEFAKVVADLLVEQKPEQNKMVPKQAEKAKLGEELRHEFITLKRRLENGSRALEHGLQQAAKENHQIHVAAVKADLQKLAGFLDGVRPNQKGETLQEIVGIEEATIDALYAATKYLYDRQNYQEAADAFGVLTLLNPNYPSFWIGFGNAEYFCNHFEAALLAYAMAVEADPEEVMPHLYSCRCYEQLHQLDNAINALDMALFVIQEKGGLTDLKQEIEREKNRLQQKMI